MNKKISTNDVLKKIRKFLPSLFWCKKSKIPSFFIFFILIVMLFIHVWRINGGTETAQVYEGGTSYSDEYIYMSANLVENIISTHGFSGYTDYRGSPYRLDIYILPYYKPEADPTIKDMEKVFWVDESNIKFTKAMLKDARLVDKMGGLVFELGDINLINADKVFTIDKNFFPSEVEFLHTYYNQSENNDEYSTGRIIIENIPLDYQTYRLEAMLQMETTEGLVERDFMIGFLPKGTKSGIDTIRLSESQILIVFFLLPLMLLMVAFIALVMKFIVRIQYAIALKIQLIVYIIGVFYMYTHDLWVKYPMGLKILLMPLFLLVLQITLYKLYSKKSYIILIILGTILAPVIFYFSFIILTTLIFGGDMKFAL